MRVHTEAGRVGSAMYTYRLFDQFSVEKSAHTFGSMVSMMCQIKRLDQALYWKKKMEKNGFHPTSILLGKLLNTAASKKDVKLVLRLLQECVDYDIEVATQFHGPQFTYHTDTAIFAVL